jgi:hypothetical protein
MPLLLSLCAASFVLSGLVACQPSPAETAAPATTAKNYIRFTFDGQTKEYTQVSLGVGQLGVLQSYHINGTSPSGETLSLAVYGTTAGTFPYRPTANDYHDVSQVTFQTKAGEFNNYKALICPTTGGYYSTPGQVVVTEYVPGKLARGTFSGALLDTNDPDLCNKQGKAFSGEFYVTKN